MGYPMPAPATSYLAQSPRGESPLRVRDKVRPLCLYMTRRSAATGRMNYTAFIEQLACPRASRAAMFHRQHAFPCDIAVEMIDDLANGVERAQVSHGKGAGKSLVQLCIQANPLHRCAAARVEVLVRIHLHPMQQPLPDAAHPLDP